MTVRVRFAPSPTGSLHLGNALSAVANRGYADAHGGALVLRIDDTDPERTVPGGEEAILADLGWLGIAWEEGPIRQSARAARHAEAAALRARRTERCATRTARSGSPARRSRAPTEPPRTSSQPSSTTSTSGSRTSSAAPTTGPNEEVQQRIARALGGELPEVIHHGLLLGEDGKKLSKRAEHASVADLREEGIPAAAVRAYLDELGLPRHDVNLDLPRIHRLAIDAIAGMPDDELAAAAGAPPELARALRGARTLVEAREIARQILRAGGRRARRGGAADARAVRGAPRPGAGARSTRRTHVRSCAS